MRSEVTASLSLRMEITMQIGSKLINLILSYDTLLVTSSGYFILFCNLWSFKQRSVLLISCHLELVVGIYTLTSNSS